MKGPNYIYVAIPKELVERILSSLYSTTTGEQLTLQQAIDRDDEGFLDLLDKSVSEAFEWSLAHRENPTLMFHDFFGSSDTKPGYVCAWIENGVPTVEVDDVLYEQMPLMDAIERKLV